MLVDPIDPGTAPISYDYLIVATGAAHAYFGHPEWAARAPGLKTLDDALEIRRRVLLAFEAAERETDPDRQRRLLTFVIVGGGPTGVELAGALAEIARQSLRQDFRSIRPESARIVLSKAARTCSAAFPEHLRDAARQSLERLGVEVRTDSIVDRHRCGRRCVERRRPPSLKLRRDRPRLHAERIAAQTVLWAAGVAASPLAEVARRAARSRRAACSREPTLQVPGHPEIFVVGDICALQQDGKPLPGVAQVAMQEGAHAARNILRAIEGEPLDAVPLSRLRQHGDHRPRVGGRRHRSDRDVRVSSPGSSGCSSTSSG